MRVTGDLDAAAGKACLAEWAVGRRASFQQVEVSREASVRRWVDAALARHGLLGPESGFVTGQEFIVDGGMTRKTQYA